MKPFRKHVAIAIDGGGIRGAICVSALREMEKALGQPAPSIFRLNVGTSTGSIISAALAAGLTATEICELYMLLGNEVFSPSWRSTLWPMTGYRYPQEPLERALRHYIKDTKMGDLWSGDPESRTDLVITAFDLVRNRTVFIKPYKELYADWPIVQAVLASCTVPTYFPVVEGRYVDGGVGAYANPCYVAAYETRLLGWDPQETTLISLGTGRDPHDVEPGEPDRYKAWDWIWPVLMAFISSVTDQQVRLVRDFFPAIDFRRFQVDLDEMIPMDDAAAMPVLIAYGQQLWEKMRNDEIDGEMDVVARGPARS